jgi:anhydro-N-acetylmuramic acid kinase
MDGIDATLAEISGRHPAVGVRFLRHEHLPYPDSVVGRLRELSLAGSTEEVCRLNMEVGECFARAALALCVDPPIDLIGSHGQTVCHIPPQGDRLGATLQIGEPDLVAARTGISVVADFRTRDMALGGQGAPLVPYADYVLFRLPSPLWSSPPIEGRGGGEGGVVLAQNIGGIANVTVIPDRLEDVFAFDTGPGNSLIDAVVRISTFGKEQMDRGGGLAAQGRVDEGLLERWMRHPFFVQKPPKSTGVECFGPRMASEMLGSWGSRPLTDLVATLTAFTARSIARAYRDFVLPERPIRQVVLSGGGARNTTLVSFLRGELPSLRWHTSDEMGVPAEAKEAVAFAILADAAACGFPAGLPSVTGASRRSILGKFCLPS